MKTAEFGQPVSHLPQPGTCRICLPLHRDHGLRRPHGHWLARLRLGRYQPDPVRQPGLHCRGQARDRAVSGRYASGGLVVPRERYVVGRAAIVEAPHCRWCSHLVIRGLPCTCERAQEEARRIRADR
jgi:hypothetical protein